MKLRDIVVLSLAGLIAIGACCFISYQYGKLNGAEWGYSEGLRVSAAWESRAKRCELNK